jgi:AcrR family transcriptional regulator
MGPVAGLRELKKQRTRAAIQEHALRLFTEQGYEATTIEQIAAAAEISPATFFRYYPTKEDVLIHDDFDPMLAAVLAQAPAELPPIKAMRHAMRRTFDSMPAGEQERARVRMKMIMSVPSVRARSIDNIMASVDLIAEPLARRLDVPVADPRVRALAGGLIGSMLAAGLSWIDDDSRDLRDVVDEALAALEELAG